MLGQVRKWKVGIRRFLNRQLYRFRAPQGTLVYVGGNRGHGLRRIAHRYGKIVVFEPDPVPFAALCQRMKWHRNIRFVNAACSTEAGEADLFVTNNNGVASSLSPLRDDNTWSAANGLKVANVIRVKTVKLLDVLAEEGIDRIETYVSDIQNHDLAVLRTLEPLVRAGRIATIEIECNADSVRSQYDGAPDCSLSAVRAFLEPEYRLDAIGEGTFIDGLTDPQTLGSEMFDTRWRVVHNAAHPN